MIKLFEEFTQSLNEGKLYDRYPPVIDPVECNKMFDSINWKGSQWDIVTQLHKVCDVLTLTKDSEDENAYGCEYYGNGLVLSMRMYLGGKGRLVCRFNMGRSKMEAAKFSYSDYVDDPKFKNTMAGFFNIIEYMKRGEIDASFNMRYFDLLMRTYNVHYKG